MKGKGRHFLRETQRQVRNDHNPLGASTGQNPVTVYTTTIYYPHHYHIIIIIISGRRVTMGGGRSWVAFLD